MKNLLLVGLLILSQSLTNCASAQKERKTPRSDTRNITVISPQNKICVQPPPQYYKSGLEANIDAKIPSIKETLEAGLSLKQTIEKLRNDLPETYNFETVEYRLCVAVQQGLISKEHYEKCISEILPGLYNLPEFIKFIVHVKSKSDNNPLPGAYISVKGSTIGATTDIEGSGILLIPREMLGNATITVSMGGNLPKEEEITITDAYIQETTIPFDM